MCPAGSTGRFHDAFMQVNYVALIQSHRSRSRSFHGGDWKFGNWKHMRCRAIQYIWTSLAAPCWLFRNCAREIWKLEAHEVQSNTIHLDVFDSALAVQKLCKFAFFPRPMTNFRYIRIAKHNFVCTTNVSIENRKNKKKLCTVRRRKNKYRDLVFWSLPLGWNGSSTPIY